MATVYDLVLPTSDKPYILANFAITLDGKVAGTKSAYWPIASRLDFEVLQELRAQVDVLIHGKNTALEYHHTKSLSQPEFTALRAKHGHTQPYTYIVVSGHPDEALLKHLADTSGVRTILVTTDAASLPAQDTVEIWRCGRESVDLALLAAELQKHSLRSCMVEGGPTLFGSFVAADLVDELFLTLSPKLIGSGGTMLSLLEGYEFPPDKVKNLELLQTHAQGSELYLRYKFTKN